MALPIIPGKQVTRHLLGNFLAVTFSEIILLVKLGITKKITNNLDLHFLYLLNTHLKLIVYYMLLKIHCYYSSLLTFKYDMITGSGLCQQTYSIFCREKLNISKLFVS